jgi:hypothetical protein
MPRIRTLKPEHKTHRKVGRLTDRQYRLWVGMITEADDEGRLVADADQLRVQIFAFQGDVTDQIVAEECQHLAKVGLIRVYKCQNTLYAVFPSWLDHQRIDKPKPSTYPRDAVRDRSKKPRRSVQDTSQTDLRGSEGSGSDRKDRKDRKDRNPAVTLATSENGTHGPKPIVADLQDIFARMTANNPELVQSEARP